MTSVPNMNIDTSEREPRNFSPSPDFKWLCNELFVKLDEVRLKPKSVDTRPKNIQYDIVINNFIHLWRVTVGNDIYPALRLILPYRDRRNYYIREHTLIRIVCDYLKLQKNSVTEQRLRRWKQKARRSINLSSFCIQEIKKRLSEPVSKEKITIDKLNSILDSLSMERSSSKITNGSSGKKLSQLESIKYCFENMSFIELEYFFDILIKARLIGGLEHKFLNAWHPDANDYLSVVSELNIVTEKLWNPNFRLNSKDLTIALHNAFEPQLAKKVNLSYEVLSRRMNNKFTIEEKMDGERIQIHYMDYGHQIKYFSRRGNDYTYLYGKDKSTATISKYLQLNEDVKECILDGEMVSYDKSRNCILPFGMVKSGAANSLKIDGLENDLCSPLFIVFDVLFLNGSPLTNLPLYQRKEYLSNILTPKKSHIEILKFSIAHDSESIRSALQAAISVGSEGIVLKKYDSLYSVGDRNNDWIKVKPEYLEQFGENLDLIVIGRDPGKKDSLMCGVAVLENEESYEKILQEEVITLTSDDDDSQNNIPEDKPIRTKRITKFISFCVIANGISNEEFKEIDRKTFGCWKKFSDEAPPTDYLEFGTRLPVEWINPHDSVVLEVKARSLENNEALRDKFKTGYTLYGAYCRRIRTDKDFNDCYTFSDLVIATNKKRSSSELYGNHSHIKKKRSRTSKVNMLNQTLSIQDDDTGFTSKIFDGLSFFVISDYVDSNSSFRLRIDELINIIKVNGGQLIFNLVSQNLNEKYVRIMSCKKTFECNELIKRGYDIIHPKWILDCIANDKLLDFEPSHCFNVSQSLSTISKQRVDLLGDSYQKYITEEELELLISSKTPKEQLYSNPLQFDQQIEKIPIFLFSNKKAYTPKQCFSEKLLKETNLYIKLYGGTSVNNINDCNVIIIGDEHSKSSNEKISSIRKELSIHAVSSNNVIPIPRIVSYKWIEKSIAQGTQVVEEDFPIIF
ncbi:hypothetical protein TPHA_0M00260 [Tetrapisispora phaffii CBS 4417]|uniref:DNA ligase n=1 Tax=Tetrapisispora phaffii (strain ATCC 24235 / CBS 4417 / NBRC 1672 / NRRL Y-8282 / UCD 70-5) TaxID=1071381 RepID=G8C0U2_TETPH|nr:hypothetical protein TPHA_0M00260 [Tetrapisispora phaffii CBS 4417]CCE65603.1 hypothetical protein TPHA_0M00260 [Tetrapisispora phaffii CBS 4417]